jgi:hypothetical protein
VKTHIYFFVVNMLMYKQILFVITAAIMLTAFATIALYTASEAHAQNATAGAAGGNATAAGAKNATAAGGNMTKNATK